MPDDEGFVNQDKLAELNEKITDVLRPIGVTVTHLVYMMDQGELTVQLVAIVRDSAAVPDQAKADREAFRRMMAEQNKAKQDEATEQIKRAMSSEEALNALLFGDNEGGDACDHNWHPEGICMTCGIERGTE